MLANLLFTSYFPLIRSRQRPVPMRKVQYQGSRATAAINLSITSYVRRNGQVVSCVTSLKSGAAKRSKTVANLRVKPRLMRDNFEARKPLREINGPEFPFWNCSSLVRAVIAIDVTQSLIHLRENNLQELFALPLCFCYRVNKRLIFPQNSTSRVIKRTCIYKYRTLRYREVFSEKQATS